MSARPDIMPRIGLSTDQSVDSGSVLVMRFVLIAVLAGFAATQIAILVTTVYLHRALAHRAMTLSRGLTWVMRVLCWITTGVRPRQRVAVHSKHPAFTDVEHHLHSPLTLTTDKA